jgi:hypothetical protein
MREKHVDRVELGREGMKLSLKLPLRLAEGGGRSMQADLPLAKSVPMEIKRRGVETKIVLEGDQTARRVDLPLLKAAARARRWVNDLLSGKVPSVEALAKREVVDRRSVRRMIRLGFLSPRIVEAIVEGRQPPELTVASLQSRKHVLAPHHPAVKERESGNRHHQNQRRAEQQPRVVGAVEFSHAGNGRGGR